MRPSDSQFPAFVMGSLPARLAGSALTRPLMESTVSYPTGGNQLYFEIEDGSFWFAHRKECLFRLLRRFPPGGLS